MLAAGHRNFCRALRMRLPLKRRFQNGQPGEPAAVFDGKLFRATAFFGFVGVLVPGLHGWHVSRQQHFPQNKCKQALKDTCFIGCVGFGAISFWLSAGQVAYPVWAHAALAAAGACTSGTSFVVAFIVRSVLPSLMPLASLPEPGFPAMFDQLALQSIIGAAMALTAVAIWSIVQLLTIQQFIISSLPLLGVVSTLRAKPRASKR